ncbi:MAG: histidine kinase, partial [Propionibacterium sp.]|nr:histidine kinase [Propionibacterium sp.]
PWPRPRPDAEHLRLNALVSLALFLASVLTMTLTGMTGVYGEGPSAWVCLLLLAGATLPLAWRFTHPWQSLLVVALCFGLAGSLGVHEFMVLQITLFLAMYSEGAWDGDRRRAAWVRVAVIIAMFVWLLVSLFRLSTDPESLDTFPAEATGWSLSPLVAFMLVQLLTNVIFFAAAYWFGDRAWRAAQDREALEYLARQLSAQQRRGERQAVALERVRIARELHDAVAHHVSLIGVQAGAARLALGTRPSEGTDATHEALTHIEEESRSAVEDMHAILHTLREGATDALTSTTLQDTVSDATGSLGLHRLPELAVESGAAGVPTTFTEVGEPAAVPPLVSLNLYRVAQEALTNVRRHAGPGTAADIRVRHGEGWVELEVSNARPPRRLGRPRSTASGLGLVGMRERVEADGGHFEAGPLSAGGWVVRARTPVRRDAR